MEKTWYDIYDHRTFGIFVRMNVWNADQAIKIIEKQFLTKQNIQLKEIIIEQYRYLNPNHGRKILLLKEKQV